jgi:predicted nucleic acid-binding protein
MATYWDSSAVLEVLLGGANAERAERWWNADETRLASILLEAECLTVLRRATTAPGNEADRSAMRRRFEALATVRDGLIVRDVDDEVLEVLRRSDGFGECRALDALHLATAIFFRMHLDEPLVVCTFDRRMQDLAVQQGLAIAPND